MNKIEQLLDTVMTIITYLATIGGFYWIFVRFIISYLKNL